MPMNLEKCQKCAFYRSDVGICLLLRCDFKPNRFFAALEKEKDGKK